MAEHVERVTLSGRPPEQIEAGAPAPIDPSTGMHKDYWVLSEAERAKGFVRQVRDAYKHVGAAGPKFQLRDLTEDEHAQYDKFGYVKFEPYPAERLPATGRYWTEADLNKIGKGCGTVTTMGRALRDQRVGT